jgi:hypothetical protein
MLIQSVLRFRALNARLIKEQRVGNHHGILIPQFTSVSVMEIKPIRRSS